MIPNTVDVDRILRHLTGESDAWDLSDTGASITIDHWYAEAAQPTEAAILAADLAAAKSDAIAAIKAEAGRRILALAPEWKQRNNLARFAELQDLEIEGTTLSTEQVAEKAALKAAGQFLRSIRDASDVMEAEANALTAVNDVEGYIAGIAADTATTPRSTDWP